MTKFTRISRKLSSMTNFISEYLTQNIRQNNNTRTYLSSFWTKLSDTTFLISRTLYYSTKHLVHIQVIFLFHFFAYSYHTFIFSEYPNPDIDLSSQHEEDCFIILFKKSINNWHNAFLVLTVSHGKMSLHMLFPRCIIISLY